MIRTIVSMIAILGIITLVGIGTPLSYACQTNAQGCIKNNGPGESVNSPPEVSGCHFFDGKQQCVRDSTPP